MGTRQGVVHLGQRVVAFLVVAMITWATLGCAKPTEPTVLLSEPTREPNRLVGQITEVSPPETLETLKQIIDAYTPQVRILSPRPGEILDSTTVAVRIQVRGLPLFKDETWQLGPHLHVFLDDQPYRAVYDLAEPLVFDDLTPGTHTLRVFASRPWHESFKNQGAFDQRTFHVLAQTPQNEVNASAPLLTYSRPQGSYGAEPIMLDFYLTNAPLHMNAQEDAKDDLHDWRIRCTVNGQSFVFDQWQPVYLKGFQPGRNWVQLELIDETGRPIENRFNNTVRIIDYQPGGDDALSRLVRGELDLRQVASIIDPTYVPPPKPAPSPEPLPSTEPEPLRPPAAESGSTPMTRPGAVPVIPAPPVETPLPPEADREPAPSAPPQLEPITATERPVAPESRPEAEEETLDLEEATELSPTQEDSEEPETTLAPTPALEPAPEAVPPLELPVALPPVTPEDNSADAATPAAPTHPSAMKGWMNRFKARQQKGRSPQPGPVIPEASQPLEPIPVYEAPSRLEEPAPEPHPEPSPEVDLPRVMPELIEPYLTRPYLTEPRTEPLPPPGVGAAPNQEQETGKDPEDSLDAEAQAPSPSQVTPPQNRLTRPYI
ncbi:MAG TPA: hypothetical protein IGR64_00490 [Leptolyngbyaceae cyanobacterium M65_K2018_010]|nr:hypothetical protein [Leptolyngbyaceae cyanobacterium M65_K2018_010]